jgi:hypothetical protein
MKVLKATQIMGLILLGAVMAGSTLAQRHGGHSGGSHFSGSHHSGSHVGIGVYFGGPAFWYYPSPYYYYPPPYYYSPYYYSPYYYYPPAATVPYSPPAYVEQGTSTERFESNWWYYCAGSDRYYPYVKECPGGWQRVTPQPPPPA